MAEKHTTITVEITPAAIWAIVGATRDSDTGDEVLNRLVGALERSEHLTLAYAVAEHIGKRQEERWKREEHEAWLAEVQKIDAGEWSENQMAFIAEARVKGHRVFLYSGRGMFGTECPAVSGDLDPDDFEAGICTDSMGMGVVVYARG